jgi:hypothetical protein
VQAADTDHVSKMPGASGWLQVCELSITCGAGAGYESIPSLVVLLQGYRARLGLPSWSPVLTFCWEGSRTAWEWLLGANQRPDQKLFLPRRRVEPHSAARVRKPRQRYHHKSQLLPYPSFHIQQLSASSFWTLDLTLGLFLCSCSVFTLTTTAR